jgi:hypothetical protein
MEMSLFSARSCPQPSRADPSSAATNNTDAALITMDKSEMTDFLPCRTLEQLWEMIEETGIA